MNKPHLALVKNGYRNPSRLDWNAVERVLVATGDDEDARTVKLQRLVLSRFFHIPPQDAEEHITDGGDDCGIDLFVIDDNNQTIHLISTKTVDAFEKAKKNFPGSEVSKLICFVRDFVGHTENLLTRCNPLLRAKIVQSWDLFDAGRVFKICVHVCSNQSGLIERDLKVLREALTEFRAYVFEYHLIHLSEEITRNWSAPTSKTVRFVGKELFEHLETDSDPETSVKSLVGSVRVADLADFLRDDKTGFVDEGLFHANVRGHLGVQNPVNAEIAATLRSDRNNRFFCLNNGVTVVCEKYFYQSGGFPVTLHRPQIINGRQTTETIFQMHRENPRACEDVIVFLRVIETSDPTLIEEISVATNNQSRIGSRDLRANSSIARKLASGLDHLGYYYVRKRGELSTLSADRTVDALKAGQLVLAYARGEPEKAKTDTTSMFGDDFEKVFNPDVVTPELIVTAHRLFSEIEAEKHRAMMTMRQSGLSAASAEHWLVEGAFHVLFCVGLGAKKLEVDLADFDRCVPLIPEAMKLVGRYYERNDRVAAYRLFRSVKARDDLRQVMIGDTEAANHQSRQLRFLFSDDKALPSNV
jgi:hypothetical protein